MSSAWKTSSFSLVAYGVVVVCLGMILSVCGTFMTHPMGEELGYVLAEAFTGFCLFGASVFMGVIRAKTESTHNVVVYLLAWTASIVLWLVCWLFQPSTQDFPLLLSLAGLHGLFWGLWCVGLALNFRSLKARAFILCSIGGITCSLGIILATRSGISRLSAVTAAACYMLFVGAQAIFAAVLLHRDFERRKISVQEA